MPGHIFLEGTDVALRVIEQTDRDHTILGWVRNNPAFRHSLGFNAPWPRSKVQEFVESIIADESSINFFICLCDEECSQDRQVNISESKGTELKHFGVDASIAGTVNLFDVDDTSGTLSYWLFKTHRGNGYATEAVSLLLEYAFNERGLHRVDAEVFEGNNSSERLLDRFGFVHEGTARDAHFTRGEFRDTYQFGLLAPEWADREEL
ncbi:GNAT family N-acetyltransferase [Halocatena marina]|uniref:GNAT family N-acetyltransferase n=1 Tax=Halocatena marina TaxID=2934937 RepID=A0ABD5YR20_9EURY|nr:GNAT family protein [Halocatena marina]